MRVPRRRAVAATAVLAIAWVAVSGTLWVAHAQESYVPPSEPTPECESVWSNYFPMPSAEGQYGPGVFEAYELELCNFWYAKRVALWRRIYREYTEGGKLVQQDVVRRHVVIEAGRTIYPFERGEPPPPQVERDGEDSSGH